MTEVRRTGRPMARAKARAWAAALAARLGTRWATRRPWARLRRLAGALRDARSPPRRTRRSSEQPGRPGTWPGRGASAPSAPRVAGARGSARTRARWAGERHRRPRPRLDQRRARASQRGSRAPPETSGNHRARPRGTGAAACRASGSLVARRRRSGVRGGALRCAMNRRRPAGMGRSHGSPAG